MQLVLTWAASLLLQRMQLVAAVGALTQGAARRGLIRYRMRLIRLRYGSPWVAYAACCWRRRPYADVC
jgi:hypothetical protein